MINFNDKENIQKLIEIEEKSLQATLSIQKNLNVQILTFIKNFIGKIRVELDFDPDKKIYHYMNESTSALNKSNNNIVSIENLLKKLNEINALIEKDASTSKIETKAQSYNKLFTKSINSIHKNTTTIENFILEISLVDLSELLKEANEITKSEHDQALLQYTQTISSDELDSAFIENTLVISDIQGKVIFPYTIEKLQKILFNNKEKYSSMEDVIEKEYTKPIKYYKFSALSRFKEAYKLVVKKEKSSTFKALSLGLELFANFNLHPAIITACNSLDELDIYLACLDDNVLEEFPFFDVKYEITPTVEKNESLLKN